VAESTVSAPDAPAPQIDLTRAAQPYDAVPIQAPLGDRESFYEPGAVTVAQLWLGQILEREAPVLRERMLRRLADAFDVKLTARARERAEELLASLDCHVEDEVFWKGAAEVANFAIYREAGERDAAELPTLEVANAAAAVLQDEIALPREELARATARRFGFGRMGKRVEESMDRGIARILERGLAREDGGQIVLP
jgi:hypothetical protein